MRPLVATPVVVVILLGSSTAPPSLAFVQPSNGPSRRRPARATSSLALSGGELWIPGRSSDDDGATSTGTGKDAGTGGGGCFGTGLRYSPPPTSAASAPPASPSSPPSSDSSAVPLDTPARRSLPPHLRLVPVPGKGLGVTAATPIPANTVVGDYVGEILTADEKDRRYLESHRPRRTMEDLAWIRSREDRGQTLTGGYVYGVTMPDGAPPLYVDSEDEEVGGWTRFVNHSSRSPNLVPKSIHESWDGRPRVWFVTARDVEEGEELCFDYGDDYWLEGDEVVS